MSIKKPFLNTSDELKDQEQRWRAAIDNIGDGLWDWNLVTNEVYFSDHWKKMLGFEPNEIEGSLDEWSNRVHPDDIENVYTDINSYLTGQSTMYFNKHRVLCKDGTYKWVLDRGAVFQRDENNKPIRMIGTHIDISEQVKVTIALEYLNKQYQAISQNIPGVIYTYRMHKDGRSCFPYASDHIYEVYGVTPEKVYADATSVFKTLHPKDRERVTKSIMDSFKNLTLWKDEYRVNHPIKGEIWLKGVSSPEKQPDESVIWYGYIEEITERKQTELKLHDAKRYYETLLDYASDAIHILDTNGNIVVFSKSFAKHLGYGYEEVKGLKVSDWDKAVPVDQLGQLIHDIIDHPRIFETKHTKKDGCIIDVQISAKGIKLDGELYLYASARDISAQKELERSLIEAKNEAESAAKAKAQFLANMSHEIRTPLNGVMGLIELAMKDEKEAKVLDYLQKAKHSSKALLHVINDILDFSKIEAGKLEIDYQPFVLSEVLETAKSIFDFTLNTNRLSFLMEIDQSIPSVLVGDSLRLVQILNNLIGNAVKFTEKGTIKITIEKSISTDQEIALKFSVIDTGIGMDKTTIEKLFHSFTQSDFSTTRKYGGTGLGLSITKRLVELMGGTIGVDSKLGKGSCFFFTLPFQLASVAQVSQLKKLSVQKERPLFNGKVLLVDDNKVNLLVGSEILQEFGVQVVCANDGKEAIEDMILGSYDMIFMDLHMPNIDGFEASKQIRSINKKIPIIALSAAVLEEDRLKASKSGMNEHLAKPIDINDLQYVLERYLHQVGNSEKHLYEKMKPIDGVDMQMLEQQFKSDRIINFLQTYARTQAEFCTEIEQMEIGSEVFRRYVHTLKGASGNLAITPVYELALAIEKTDDVSQKGELLRQLCQQLQKTINSIIHTYPEKRVESQMSKNDLLKTLEFIKTDLKSHRMVDEVTLHTLIDGIKQYVSDDAAQAMFESIDGFDFKRAIILVKEIEERLNAIH